MNLLEANAVTTKEALKRAFWMVKVPSMVLMAVPPIFLLAIIGRWLAWSVQVPKWRLWVYEREVIEKAHA